MFFLKDRPVLPTPNAAVLGVFYPGLKLTTTLPQKIKNDPYIPSDDDIKSLLDYVKFWRVGDFFLAFFMTNIMTKNVINMYYTQ